ncbi:hypothetical protein GGU10DRAFT_384574 [Lentinula aff. detonsa]|uniref:Uncharacterized protein n=1 Tax=Lentinula aff. detonsa TaxID=2804958 RepID=A0AA38KUN1_9AGAR|nr:hypothetical protein GGU10DRAFT_384574 [Lentinula aff. detonsa]
MQSAPTNSSPAGRKKPHCRKCGLPMEGHRKGECDGATERFESGSPDDSDCEGLAGSDGEKKDLICSKRQSSPSPSRFTRASFSVGRNQKPPTSDKGESPVIQPITGAPSKGKTNLKVKSKRFSASRDGDVSGETVLNEKDTSSFFDQEEKPVFTPSDIEPSSNAKARRSSAIAEIDEEVELPSPKAFIYASSDFLELGEAGTAVRDRILKNDEGKSYHAGVFYTPTPLPNSESYAYKEWVVVGRGEGAEALVKHVVRLADSQSVLRSRAPGSFIVGNELEIVEGPRMVTIPQLLFGSCVAVVLFMYILSAL